MAKTKQLRYSVPEAWAKEVDAMVYTYLYQKDAKKAIILMVLKEKSDLSLAAIKWILTKDYGITRKIGTLRTMAENCGLPYTEKD